MELFVCCRRGCATSAVSACPECQAALLVALYSAAVRDGKCKICEMSCKAATALDIPKLPVLVTAEGTVVNGILPIVECILMTSTSQVVKQILLGNTPYEKALVDQWLAFAVERSMRLSEASSLHTLNRSLESKTFATGNHISLADLVLYPMVYPWMEKASTRERIANCSITRWFDHIQHLPGIAGIVPGLDSLLVVPSDIVTRPVGVQQNNAASAAQSSAAEKSAQQMGKEKKGKGQKGDQDGSKSGGDKGKKVAAGGKVDTEKAVDDPTRIEIRVGLITKVWAHPEADSLYCEEIDIGEAEPRKIASGLRSFLPIEGLLNQKVCVLANLKSRNLRKFPSHGMVLCASNSDHSVTELVRPPAEAKVGELVFLEGISGNAPDAVLPAKEGKDPFKAVSPHWRTGEDKIAYFKESKWMTSAGPCYCDTLTNGSIS